MQSQRAFKALMLPAAVVVKVMIVHMYVMVNAWGSCDKALMYLGHPRLAVPRSDITFPHRVARTRLSPVALHADALVRCCLLGTTLTTIHSFLWTKLATSPRILILSALTPDSPLSSATRFHLPSLRSLVFYFFILFILIVVYSLDLMSMAFEACHTVTGNVKPASRAFAVHAKCSTDSVENIIVLLTMMQPVFMLAARAQ